MSTVRTASSTACTLDATDIVWCTTINERGKGDHVHYGDTEQPYQFVSVAQLLADFAADIRRLTGGQP
jgi:hypothetical protein